MERENLIFIYKVFLIIPVLKNLKFKLKFIIKYENDKIFVYSFLINN